jgi:hypothetical protein
MQDWCFQPPEPHAGQLGYPLNHMLVNWDDNPNEKDVQSQQQNIDMYIIIDMFIYVPSFRTFRYI